MNAQAPKVKYRVEVVDSQGHLMTMPWTKGHVGPAAVERGFGPECFGKVA